VISWFLSLAIHDKLMIIGFWMLGIILLYTWAVFITKRLGVKSLPAEYPSQASENPKQGTARHYEASKHQKPKDQFRIRRLLGSCCHIVKDKGVRCPAHSSGGQSKQPTQRVEPKNLGRVRIILPPLYFLYPIYAPL
jgi:hypothetical protein